MSGVRHPAHDTKYRFLLVVTSIATRASNDSSNMRSAFASGSPADNFPLHLFESDCDYAEPPQAAPIASATIVEVVPVLRVSTIMPCQKG